jgi:hypothetical protein
LETLYPEATDELPQMFDQLSEFILKDDKLTLNKEDKTECDGQEMAKTHCITANDEMRKVKDPNMK